MAIVESKNTQAAPVDAQEVAEQMTDNKNKGKNISQFKKEIKQSIEQTEIEIEIQKKILKEAEAAHLQQKKDELENDETHKQVLQNTVNNPPKVFVPRLFPKVEYSFDVENKSEGKPTQIHRDFKIEFEWDDEREEYFLIVKKKKLCKQDVLNLYNAFRVVVKDTMDSLFAEIKLEADKKEQRELQIKLFAQDFRQPDILEIPIALPIFTRLANEIIDFKFPVIKLRGVLGYALKLNSENALTCQDIYYVYANYDQILNKALNKEDIKEVQVA